MVTGSHWFPLVPATGSRLVPDRFPAEGGGIVAGQSMETDRSHAYTRAHAAPQQSTAGTASLGSLRLPCYVERRDDA